jgi:hypothetical protein
MIEASGKQTALPFAGNGVYVAALWNTTKNRIGTDGKSFTCKVAGWYSIDAQVEVTNTSDAGLRTLITAKRKGVWGNLVPEQYTPNAGNTMKSKVMTNSRFYMDAGDFLQVHVKVSVGNSPSLVNGGGHFNLKWLSK